jgi:hypothetical protein
MGEDLPLAISPSNEQLENINSYLNLILAALVSLANLDSESITQAAQELALPFSRGEGRLRAKVAVNWRISWAYSSLRY